MAALSTDYLIIGNSAAGVTAAETIRLHDSEGSVAIISNEPYAAYGRPLISYLIEGKTSEDHLNFKPSDFYDRNDFQTYFGPEYEVVKLMPDDHQAELKNGSLVSYGKCLLATGSVPFTPPIEGLAEKNNVFPFLSLDDAKAAWAAAVDITKKAHDQDKKSRVVVIGAGLIGLKAAEALSHHVDEVVVLEMAPHILPAVLDDEGAAVLQKQLTDHGITCMPGITANKFLSHDDEVYAAELTNGETLDCDMVIAAVGVRPNSSLAIEAGAEQGKGLVCDEFLQTTLKDVYAAGDVVQVTDVLDGSQKPLALWPNAMQQGRLAGLSMVGPEIAEAFEGSFAVNAVDFFDISLLTAGIINPRDAEKYQITTTIHGNTYTKLVVSDGCLVGYIMLNRPKNAGIYTYLIENSIPLDTLDSDLLTDPPENLDFPTDLRWQRLHKFYPKDRDKRGWRERAQ